MLNVLASCSSFIVHIDAKESDEQMFAITLMEGRHIHRVIH
jgi:hypothetical protein